MHVFLSASVDLEVGVLGCRRGLHLLTVPRSGAEAANDDLLGGNNKRRQRNSCSNLASKQHFSHLTLTQSLSQLVRANYSFSSYHNRPRCRSIRLLRWSETGDERYFLGSSTISLVSVNNGELVCILFWICAAAVPPTTLHTTNLSAVWLCCCLCRDRNSAPVEFVRSQSKLVFLFTTLGRHPHVVLLRAGEGKQSPILVAEKSILASSRSLGEDQRGGTEEVCCVFVFVSYIRSFGLFSSRSWGFNLKTQDGFGDRLRTVMF
ncbi:hypothetical protein BaRGS_00029598, partial [Batillaria attramentaria]